MEKRARDKGRLIDLAFCPRVPSSFISALSKIFHKRQNIHVPCQPGGGSSVIIDFHGRDNDGVISPLLLSSPLLLPKFRKSRRIVWRSLFEGRVKWSIGTYRSFRPRDTLLLWCVRDITVPLFLPLLVEFYSESLGITCSTSVERFIRLKIGTIFPWKMVFPNVTW